MLSYICLLKIICNYFGGGGSAVTSGGSSKHISARYQCFSTEEHIGPYPFLFSFPHEPGRLLTWEMNWQIPKCTPLLKSVAVFGWFLLMIFSKFQQESHVRVSLIGLAILTSWSLLFCFLTWWVNFEVNFNFCICKLKLWCLVYAEAFNLIQFDEKANYLFICNFPIPSVQNQQKLILLAQQIRNTRELKMIFGFGWVVSPSSSGK